MPRTKLSNVTAALTFVSVILTSAAFANHTTQSPEITLPEGTAINVVTAQAITSKTANPGDSVDFKVNDDVVVNGQVIVTKGTPAKGFVINAEPGRSLGKSGKLGITVETTTMVDGRTLKLRAAKGREGDDKTTSTFVLSSVVPFFLFKKGGDAKFAEGTPVTVYVAEEKRFQVVDSKLVAIDAPAQPAAAESTADAVVYVYRPDKLMGKALEPSVFVDETEVARMDNGRYFTVRLKPGKHMVHMTSKKKGFAIDMGPGQNYYFRVGLEMGMWKGQGKLTLEDADKAIPEIKKLKFLGKDKIKDETLVVEVAPPAASDK
jgi:hypothetical protein